MSNPFHKPAGTPEGGEFTSGPSGSSEHHNLANKMIASGAQVGSVYHGSKQRVDAIDPAKLQSRDSGFYGGGFYTTTNKEFAKTYGPRVSEFKFSPNATVLNASLEAKNAPAGLVEQVQGYEHLRGFAAASARGKADAFREYVKSIPENNMEWKNAVNRFAEAHGFDAVNYGAGEVVIKNPASVVAVKKSKRG